jgi:hypothetical protein
LNGDNLKRYKLNPHEKDSAWHKIEENFMKTIPDGKILNIELIQDIELWKQYQKEYEKVSQSLGK